MADYKLVYLNYRGRAELIRFIFAYAGVAYEDSRIDAESWPKKRPGTHTSMIAIFCALLQFLLGAETQFGLLPYLEIRSSGITISGNATVARYLAEKYSEYKTYTYMHEYYG